MQYFYFHMRVFFLFLGACNQHTKKCHLHMDISPGDRGITNSLFNPTCSLLPPLSSTKLELCRHFLYQVTGSLLSCWPHAQMPVTKSHHSLWKDICISRHSKECLVGQAFYRMPGHSIDCLAFQSLYRMPKQSIKCLGNLWNAWFLSHSIDWRILHITRNIYTLTLQ